MLLVSNDLLVSLDATRTSLVTIDFKEGEISFKKTHVSDLVDESFGTAVILPSKLSGMFAVGLNTLLVFIKVTTEGKFEVVNKTTNATAVSDALSFSEGQQAFALVEHVDKKILLTVKLVHKWNGDLPKESIAMDHQRGLLQKVFINTYICRDWSYGFRALIVMEDRSLLCNKVRLSGLERKA